MIAPARGRAAARATRGLLDEIEDGVPVDFLREVAAELPMQMICILLGVPEADRHALLDARRPGIRLPRGRRRSASRAGVDRGAGVGCPTTAPR